MTGRRWTIDEVNEWDKEMFVARLGGVFESSPWIAERGWGQRPFRDISDLHERLRDVVGEAPTVEQLALIHAHPDLVGRAALAGRLTRASAGEQSDAGLDPDSLSREEIELFAALNAGYRARFEFPFVICARENQQAAIIAGLVIRVGNSIHEERRTALYEIAKIAWYRLSDQIAPYAAGRAIPSDAGRRTPDAERRTRKSANG